MKVGFVVLSSVGAHRRAKRMAPTDDGTKEAGPIQKNDTNSSSDRKQTALLFRFLRAHAELIPTMPFLPTYFTEEPKKKDLASLVAKTNSAMKSSPANCNHEVLLSQTKIRSAPTSPNTINQPIFGFLITIVCRARYQEVIGRIEYDA